MNYLRPLLAFVLCASAVGPLGAATASAQSAPASPSPAETTAPDATVSTLSGVAKDSLGGPLAGVTITVTGPLTKSTTTGSDGSYALAGLTPGLYTLTAQKSGYQRAEQSDFAVLAGAAITLDVTLTAQTLSSLRTIGSVYTQAGRTGFNTSGLSVATLTAQRMDDRNLPNLKQMMQELPGVTIFEDSGSRTPNSNFVIRGSEIETATVIDGHALSSGVFGTYNINYANPDIFQNIEVLKGAGLNGIYGGIAGVGVVNMQTRDFSTANSASFKLGYDSYQGQLYTGSFNLNFLNGRIQLLGVRVYQGENGPNINSTQYQLGAAPTTSYSQLGGAGGNYTGLGLIQWASTYSDPYTTQANLLKLRLKFTPDIWLTGEYLGLYGSYYPQAGSYGLYYGNFPVAACGNLSKTGAVTPVAAGSGGCTVASVYNAPYISPNQIGQNASFYGYFPNSYIANDEPTFSAELRAKTGDNTFFLRPYSAIIDRFINGTLENTQPGYGSAPRGAAAGWYQVVNTADCQVQFVYNPAGSSGPCFSGNNYSHPYVYGAAGPTAQFPTVFPVSYTAPNCTAATPCWTTPTNQQNNGYYGYNTPFSQPEVDRERGFTFSWLRPYKDDLFNLSFDYSKDDTIKFSGDTSPVSAGCYNVVSTGKIPNTPTYTPPGSTTPEPNPYYQPNCQVNGKIYPYLPSNSLQIPPTQNYQYLTSGSALIQATDQLQLGAALYYTFQNINYQFTDPEAAALAASRGLPGAEQANATLIGGTSSHSSVNPHFQAQFRASPDLSIRANAGSSVTLPYNGLVSGFTSLSPNGGPTGQDDVLTAKNPQLLPETVVAYNLGFDFRTPDNSILSSDVYDNTVHNVFVTQTTVVPNIRPLPPGAETLLNTTLNGPLERSYGLEVTFSKAPVSGFGYFATASLNRAYYDQFGLAFYESLNGSTTPIVNGKQLDGTSSFTSQIPYFKAAAEINYRTATGRSGFTLGDAFYGNNNSTGGPPYFNAYGSIYTTVAQGLRLGLSCQNLFNYNSGTFTANGFAFAGFNPIGAKLVNGNVVLTNAYSTPNAIVSVPPRTFYVTGEYRI